MERLVEIGFQKVGFWRADNGHARCALHIIFDSPHTLYAFVLGDQVQYVGKTSRGLKARMDGYQKPGVSQSTNIRVNRHILDELQRVSTVDIWAISDSDDLQKGCFRINLVDGLEADMIRQLNPPWNKMGVEVPGEVTSSTSANRQEASTVPASPAVTASAQSDGEGPYSAPTFQLQLGVAYFNQGFLNIGVAYERYIGGDRAPVTIQLGPNGPAIDGWINRTANGNNTPRIMGGKMLTDWIQARFKLKGWVQVETLNHHAIRLSPPK